MTVGSLFAGIGGFDLGLERAGFNIRWQCENNSYCRKLLAKHWPAIPHYRDIRTVSWGMVEPVDLLCGGFPCQDLSFAGKRAGIDGARSGLWSEYVRAIVQLRPRYVLVENVPGLLSNPYLGRVLGDLAQSGYDAEWDCIPAAKCGAPHRRDRVWIIAYPSGGRQFGKLWHQIETAGARSRDDLFGELSQLSWREAISKLHGVDDGLPHWVDRLRGLGNAIVPQIAEALGRMILEADKCVS